MEKPHALLGKGQGDGTLAGKGVQRRPALHGQVVEESQDLGFAPAHLVLQVRGQPALGCIETKQFAVSPKLDAFHAEMGQELVDGYHSAPCSLSISASAAYTV